jgi:hypothetical protein
MKTLVFTQYCLTILSLRIVVPYWTSTAPSNIGQYKNDLQAPTFERTSSFIRHLSFTTMAVSNALSLMTHWYFWFLFHQQFTSVNWMAYPSKQLDRELYSSDHQVHLIHWHCGQVIITIGILNTLSNPMLSSTIYRYHRYIRNMHHTFAVQSSQPSS